MTQERPGASKDTSRGLALPANAGLSPWSHRMAERVESDLGAQTGNVLVFGPSWCPELRVFPAIQQLDHEPVHRLNLWSAFADLAHEEYRAVVVCDVWGGARNPLEVSEDGYRRYSAPLLRAANALSRGHTGIVCLTHAGVVCSDAIQEAADFLCVPRATGQWTRQCLQDAFALSAYRRSRSEGPPPQEEPGALVRQGHLLLVDCDVRTLDLKVAAAQDLGLTCETAAGIDVAREMLLESPERFDILCMNLRVSLTDGGAPFRSVLPTIEGRIPCVLDSSYSRSEVLYRQCSAGLFRFVELPLLRATFQDVIERGLELRRAFLHASNNSESWASPQALPFTGGHSSTESGLHLPGRLPANDPATRIPARQGMESLLSDLVSEGKYHQRQVALISTRFGHIGSHEGGGEYAPEDGCFVSAAKRLDDFFSAYGVTGRGRGMDLTTILPVVTSQSSPPRALSRSGSMTPLRDLLESAQRTVHDVPVTSGGNVVSMKATMGAAISMPFEPVDVLRNRVDSAVTAATRGDANGVVIRH